MLGGERLRSLSERPECRPIDGREIDPPASLIVRLDAACSANGDRPERTQIDRLAVNGPDVAGRINAQDHEAPLFGERAQMIRRRGTSIIMSSIADCICPS